MCNWQRCNSNKSSKTTDLQRHVEGMFWHMDQKNSLQTKKTTSAHPKWPPRPPHRLECWGDMDNDKDEAYEAGGLERSSHRCQGSYLLIGILTMICKDQLANTKNCDWNMQLYLDLPIPKVQFQPPIITQRVPCIFGPTSEESCCWFREVDKIQGITSTLTAWQGCTIHQNTTPRKAS